MNTTNDSAAAVSQSLTDLFNKVEAEFPPRFREHGWCLTILASFVGTGQQQLAGRLYQHLISQPQYETSEARQALVRRMREALVKCIIINGIPVVIGSHHIYFGRREGRGSGLFLFQVADWNVGPESSERAAKVLKVLYKSEEGGHVKTLQSHLDIPWISVNVSYGLFLSDHRILNMQETELVVLPAIMTQNLRGPTYWYLRACLRVGIEPDEVEAIHQAIEAVAEYGGKTLDVQRVKDVDDA
ncbi:hypothetical protein QBC35DRAFT_457551 [Podospora australis]|uniref:Uncharacterized protein n=1 Tax=Podospora australis TaxID=1536484 RepID=A0AAN7ACJ1_9PEZI|nr:hypothetical protein QBC35DRAFT_457551 [Podospora australis]